MINLSNNSVKYVLLHTGRDAAKTVEFGTFCVRQSVFWVPIRRKYSRTFNNHAFCCRMNLMNTLLQLIRCLLISCQFESTSPLTAKILMLHSWQDD